jgi:hypothetical protein
LPGSVIDIRATFLEAEAFFSPSVISRMWTVMVTRPEISMPIGVPGRLMVMPCRLRSNWACLPDIASRSFGKNSLPIACPLAFAGMSV